MSEKFCGKTSLYVSDRGHQIHTVINAEGVREIHACEDGAQRVPASHAADLLQRQSQTGRPHEGAAGGNDRPQSSGHPRLVPEQAMQR